MSTRAYKVIEVKTEKDPTFSVSRNWDFVEEYGRFSNDGGGDFLIFEEDDIKRGLKEEKDKEKLDILRRIKKDIPKGDTCVEYICY